MIGMDGSGICARASIVLTAFKANSLGQSTLSFESPPRGWIAEPMESAVTVRAHHDHIIETCSMTVFGTIAELVQVVNFKRIARELAVRFAKIEGTDHACAAIFHERMSANVWIPLAARERLMHHATFNVE